MQSHFNDEVWNYMMTTGITLSLDEIKAVPAINTNSLFFSAKTKDELMTSLLTQRLKTIENHNKNIFETTKYEFNNLITLIDSDIALIHLPLKDRELFANCPNFLQLQEKSMDEKMHAAYEMYQRLFTIHKLTYDEFKFQISFLLDEKVKYFKNFSSAFSVDSERLRLILEFGDRHLFEYDFNSKNLYLGGSFASKLKFERTNYKLSDFLDQKQELILPQSIDDFKKLITDIQIGTVEGSCSVGVRVNEKIIWLKLFYHTIKDKDNKKYWLIGFAEEIIKYENVNFAFSKIDQMGLLNSSGTIFRLRYSLANEYLGIYWNKEQLFKVNTYQEFLNEISKRILNEEERLQFNKMFNLDYLKFLYDSGNDNVSLRINCDLGDGNIEWFLMSAVLGCNPLNKTFHLFIVFQNITATWKIENSIETNITYDYSTHLYDYDTTKTLINYSISRETNPLKRCIMMIFTFPNFGEASKRYGYDIINKIFILIAKVVRISFGTHAVIGTGEGAKIIVYSHKDIEPYLLRYKVNDCIHLASKAYTVNDSITDILQIQTSIYFDTVGNTYFDKLYNDTYALLNNARSNVTLVDNIRRFVNAQANLEQISNIVIDKKKGYNRFVELVRSNQKIVDSSNVISTYLKFLVKEYVAFSSYVLRVKENKAYIAYVHSVDEAIEEGHEPIDLNECPVLNSILNTHTFQLIKAVETNIEISRDEKRIWSDYHINTSMILPLQDKNMTIGYLVLNGISDSFGDDYLLNICGSYIALELAKVNLAENAAQIYELDDLTKVYNKIKLKMYFEELKYHNYSSVGVLSVGINNIGLINKRFGGHYGNRIICSVADGLKKYFKLNDIYRNDSTNFMVIVSDITFEAFKSSIKEFEEYIAKIDKSLVTVGFTWSNQDIDVLKMYSNAEELMSINRNQDTISETINNQARFELEQCIEKGYFKMFLQPKFDLHHGIICGSEALIRLEHPEYGLIPPSKFIPQIEEANFVSKVDFYMLECACKTLRQWIDEGYDVDPISVNYSRITLLEKDAIGHTKEILQKYRVPNHLIEIEITETIGNIEQSIVIDIANKFIAAGIPLSLDDFGSKYSSLSTVVAINFNSLKIDKSIVNDITTNYRSQLLLSHIVGYANQVNMKVIAEGVETESQYLYLKDIGCDQAQGFLFERPIPVDQFKHKYMR